MDGDRQRHPGRRAGQRRARGPEAQGPALRRLGDAGLRVVRRWRPLAVAAAEHGAVVGPRPASSKTTTSSSARTAAASGFSTTSRRCGRSTRDRPRIGDAVPLQAAGRRCACGGTRTPTRRCRPTSRGAESARRRDHQLLPEVRGVRARSRSRSSAATASSCAGTRAPTKSLKPDPATITVPLYWFRAADAAVRGGRHAPLHLGRALSAADPSTARAAGRASAGRTCRSRPSLTTPCRRRRRRGCIPASTRSSSR